jgi:hypothetical protein
MTTVCIQGTVQGTEKEHEKSHDVLDLQELPSGPSLPLSRAHLAWEVATATST